MSKKSFVVDLVPFIWIFPIRSIRTVDTTRSTRHAEIEQAGVHGLTIKDHRKVAHVCLNLLAERFHGHCRTALKAKRKLIAWFPVESRMPELPCEFVDPGSVSKL